MGTAARPAARAAIRPAARATAAAAAFAIGLILTGCDPGAQPAPSATTAPPGPAPTPTEPTPTPTGSTDPTATSTPSETAGTAFETQNGTMRLQVPEGWTVDDQSHLTTDHIGRPVWDNSVGFRSPSGTEVGYYDGFGSNVGFFHTDYAIVEQRPTADDRLTAMSWWIRDADRYFVHAGVTAESSEGLEPIPELFLPGLERNHRLTMLLLGDDQPTVASEAEAEALLRGADVLEALDVMATLELTGVPYDAMPPGVEP